LLDSRNACEIHWHWGLHAYKGHGFTDLVTVTGDNDCLGLCLYPVRVGWPLYANFHWLRLVTQLADFFAFQNRCRCNVYGSDLLSEFEQLSLWSASCVHFVLLWIGQYASCVHDGLEILRTLLDPLQSRFTSI
jgi:hypothetical protein